MRKFFIAAAASVLTACSGDIASIDSGRRAAATKVSFTDKTKESRISFEHRPARTENKWIPEIMGSGVAIADVNRDGAPDVLLVNSGAVGAETRPPDAANRLFINDGRGSFTDRTEEWNFTAIGYGQGIAVGDFDNDGWPDVFLTNLEGDNRLLRNTGNRFEDVSAAAGIRRDGKWATSAGFFDLEGDGDLDIFVARYVEFSTADDRRGFHNRVPIYPTPVLFTSLPDQLLINDGKGRFIDASERFGLSAAPGKGLALAIGDVNRDGRPDIYVANDTDANQLWVAKPDGSQTEICRLAGCAYSDVGRAEGSMGADLSDIDSNGLPDIAVTNFQDEATAIYSQTAPLLFVEVADRVGIGGPSRARLSFGIDFFDANNDGSEDLLFVNGHIEDNIHLNSETVTFAQQNSLFEHLGDGKFRDISNFAGDAFNDIQVSRGLATGDLNGDGAIDFVVNNNGGTAQVAFNSSTAQGGFVVLWLEGVKANRSAIGARLVAKIGERTIERQVMGAQSYLSMSDLRVHFGLGEAEVIDELTIHWPGSEPQTIRGLGGNAFYYIREGRELVSFIPGEKRVEP